MIKDNEFLDSFGLNSMILDIDHCLLTIKYKNWRIKNLVTKDWKKSGFFAFNLKTREVLPLSTERQDLCLDIFLSELKKKRIAP